MKGHKELKHRAKGGAAEQEYTPNVEVEKEAKERKRGGRAGDEEAEDYKESEHEDKPRKRGGKVERGIEGKKPKHKLDRPGRKDGGRVGSDKNPFSSAHSLKDAEGHSTDD